MNIHIEKAGKRLGPYALDQVKLEVLEGRLEPSDLAWIEGWANWQPLSAVPGFSVPPPMAVEKEVVQVQGDLLPGELVRLFIGKNGAYYVGNWLRMDQAGTVMSWNWASFFLGIGWMGFRKMYLYTFIAVGVLLAETACEEVFSIPNSISHGLDIGLWIAYGTLGNWVYGAHVRRKFRELAPSGEADEAALRRLGKAGGTSVLAGIAFTIAFFAALIGIIVAKS